MIRGSGVKDTQINLKLNAFSLYNLFQGKHLYVRKKYNWYKLRADSTKAKSDHRTNPLILYFATIHQSP